MNANADKKADNRKAQTFRRILQCIQPYKGLVLLSFFLAIVSTVSVLALPILIGNGVDRIIGPGQVDFEGLTGILIRLLLLILTAAVSQYLMNTVNNRITYHIVMDLREKAFRHVHVLPLSYLDVHSTGDLISRVVTDIEQFSDGLLLGFTQLFTGVVTILGTLVFMFSLQPLVTLVVLAFTPVSFFVASFISGRTYTYFKGQSESRGRLTDLTNEALGNIKVVQTFGQEKKISAEFDRRNKELSGYSMNATFYSSLTNPTTRFVNSLIYNGVVICGCLLCFMTPFGAEVLTIGGLTSFLSYVKQFSQPFNEITAVLTEFQNSLASASRVFELIDEEPEPADLPDAAVMGTAEGHVDLENVSFSYVPERPLIENLSVHAAPGMRIAIVGPTGCGKTTLINLLMRFYDVNNGAVCVDGTDIRRITRSSLRENYGMVLQDTWLRSGTIRDNIAYGRPEATDEEIIAAAKKAHAHSFIRRMENGYDTVIEENGGNLSAGQKQLLCIARVMLDLPPILILDEATSSIDTRTEIRIQKAFDEMMKGRTSFIVAHRLSTIRDADLILVMKDGHIIEQGNHDTLLASGGFYADLYRSQFAAS